MLKRFILLFYIYFLMLFIPITNNLGISDIFIPKIYAQEVLKVNSINFDNSDSIIFLGTSSGDGISDYNITKKQLSEPDRIFFDIDNAVITFQNKTFELKNSKIKKLKIAQNSIDPNIVRIVIWNSDGYDSSKIKVLKMNNNIIIKLDDEKPLQQYLTQIYRETDSSSVEYFDKTVVVPDENATIVSDEIFSKVQNAFKEDSQELVRPNIEQKQARLKSRFFLESITNSNGSIILSGIGVVNIKRPLLLNNPYRIVYDLPNTILLQELHDKEIKISDDTTIKIAQFSPSTVRLVLKTLPSNNYIPVYSTNLQSVTLVNDRNVSSISNGISKVELTYFKEQKVNSSTDVVNVIFSNPVVYSLNRVNDKIVTTLYNLSSFDVNSFNNIALLNKTGFEAKQTGYGIYSLYFPVASNQYVDCYETLNASQLRFVFTKKHLPLQNNEIKPVNPTFADSSKIPVLKPIKKDDLSESIKTKKAIKKKRQNLTGINKIKNRVIIIDPGHGGNDTGAMRGKVLEKDLTLQIAKKIEKILKDNGFKNVIMTRSTDKTLTLQDRVDIANSNCADIYVSIHINASVKNEINGIETHYYWDKGYDVAKIIHNKIIAKVDAEDRGLFKSKFYVINHTEAPAVLLELGFISNEKERNSLQSEKRQMDSAQAVADGIIDYLMEH